MDGESKQIRRQLRTQSVDPHRVPTRTSTYITDFRHKDAGESDIAELFHENTKYSQIDTRKFNRSIDIFSTEIDMELREEILPTAARDDLETIALPEPRDVSGSITRAVRRRQSVRKYSGEELRLEHLSTILQYGCGVLRPGPGGESLLFRGYPSAGGLYPIEPYLVVVNVSDIPAGIYYYSATDHELKVIEKMDRAQVVDAVEPGLNLPQGTELKNIAVGFLLTGAFWKTKAKYGPRGYRFALLEAGHLAQNVQLVSAGLELGSCNLGGTDEVELDPLLGANGVDESIVYGFVVGHPAYRGETDG